MSDEANVNESSEPQGEPEATTVSDAMEAREPGSLADEAAEVMAAAEELPDAGPPVPEEERKAGIQTAMRVTARETTARKQALKTAHLDKG